MPESKHVIFLGAGASLSAGYPLGPELAELMKQPGLLQDKIARILGWTEQNPILPIRYEKVICPFINHFQQFIDLFEGSGYPTIDEFSELARTEAPTKENHNHHKPRTLQPLLIASGSLMDRATTTRSTATGL